MMIRTTVLSATGIAILVLAAGGSAAQPRHPDGQSVDSAFGFRDVRLGTPLSAFGEVMPVETIGPGRVCYERRGEDLHLGDGVARSIRYCFAAGVLEAIVVDAQGERNTNALLETFRVAFGRGERERDEFTGAARRIVWDGQRAAAYYGEPRGPDAAQARVWALAPGTAAAAVDRPRHRRFEGRRDGPPPPTAGSLQLNVPRHVRRGLVAQVSIRYRDLNPPGAVRLLLPPEFFVESTVPVARVEGPEVIWENLASASGSLKLKVLVRGDAPTGAAPALFAELLDGAGGRTGASAIMNIR